MTIRQDKNNTHSFSSMFIYRPVATILLMCSIVISGLLGYFYLPVAPLPQVDYPTIQVTTYYPGASPDIMTTAITAPLERQFGQVSGLEQMYSQNGQGVSVITLQFNLDLSMDIAEQEVQAAINAARQLLPNDLPYPPIYNKVNPADAPILTIAVTSDILPMTQVADLVQNRLVHELSQVSGIGLVTQSGGQKPSLRIDFNSQAIAQYGLDSETLRAVIAQASINTAKGSFDGPLQSMTIAANDQLKTVEEYNNIIISNGQTGGVLRLADIATISQAPENLYIGAWSDNVPAIILNIQRQPGANVINAVDEIKTLLPMLIETLPKSVKVDILTDRTSSIRTSIHDVQIELFFAIFLVILVIYFFLRNIRATLIASIAVPLSIIGTFAIIYLMGFSINNLTLMALTIATGFVVDDAIVVIENITRYIESKNGDSELKQAQGEPLGNEEGLSALDAALVGAKEIGFTIISLTISLVAVLIPLLFMGDIIGRLFYEFAVTLAIAILISGVVSLTLTPMLCAKLLKKAPHHKSNSISYRIETFFNWVISGYSSTLRRILMHPKKMLTLIVLTFLSTVSLYWVIPKGFFPIQDNSLIQATIIAPPSSSYQKMTKIQHEVSSQLASLSDIENIASFIGVDNTNVTLNTLQVQIGLSALDERTTSLDTIKQDIHQALAEITGIEVYLQSQQDLTIDTQKSRSPYRFTLQATSTEQFDEWIPKISQSLEGLSTLSDVSHDWQNNGNEIYIEINRDIASRMGITVKAINDALYNAFGQRQVNTLYTHSNQYRIVMQSLVDNTADAHALSMLNAVYLKNNQGEMIPLDVLAHIKEQKTSLALNRLAQFPVTTFYFDVNHNKGVSLEDAVHSIETSIAKLDLPKDMRIQFQGATLAFNAALTDTIFLIIAAVITMYIVLGVLYESFIHPVTILSTLPSAAIGALIALMISGKSFDMIAVIGIILLIGIVKKNAIMMIDFALVAQREHHLAPKDAIIQAAILRFRPILMTTMAAILGAIPLMLSQGVGSELRQPLGISLVGGLLLSQILTLYTTPVIYLFFDKLSRHKSDTISSDRSPSLGFEE